MNVERIENYSSLLFLNHEFPPVGGGAGKSTFEIAKFFPGCRIMTMRYAKRNGSVNGLIEIPPRRIDQSRCSLVRMFLFSLTSFFRILLTPKKDKPRTIIAFFTIPAGLTALMAKQILKIPYVVWLRGGDVPGFMPHTLGRYHRLLRPMIHYIWKCAELVASNGESLRLLAQKSLPGLEVINIPNGIEPMNQNQNRRQIPFKAVFAGRLVFEQKGVETLPEVWQQIKHRFSHLEPQLVVIGDGPALSYLKAHLKDRNVDFTHWLDRDQVIEHLRSSHLFLYLSKYEGVSNALLEALASGNLVLMHPDADVDIICRAPGVYRHIEQINIENFKMLSFANYHFSQRLTWNTTAKKLKKLFASL